MTLSSLTENILLIYKLRQYFHQIFVDKLCYITIWT